jgi:hypothetical protein
LYGRALVAVFGGASNVAGIRNSFGDSDNGNPSVQISGTPPPREAGGDVLFVNGT